MRQTEKENFNSQFIRLFFTELGRKYLAVLIHRYLTLNRVILYTAHSNQLLICLILDTALRFTFYLIYL